MNDLDQVPDLWPPPDHRHDWERGIHMAEAFGVDGRRFACAICGKYRGGGRPLDEPTLTLAGCLETAWGRDKGGYGRRCVGGRMRRAHRWAWEHEVGPIPAGLHVLHRCDNPPCVNVHHLFLGTNADNMADRDRKGRAAWGDRNASRRHPERNARGARCNPHSGITEAVVLTIRARLAAGATRRQVCQEMGVHKSVVARIARRKTWTHV